MLKRKAKAVNHAEGHVEKTRKFKMPKNLSPVILFMTVAFAIVVGYVAGVHHYDIEAAVGPIFGYKAHQGTLNLDSVQETYNKLASYYDGKLDTAALIEGANKGLVEAVGDTYTMYMSASDASDFNDSLTGNIGGGIGAEIGLKNNNVTIMRVLDNNPAKKAGLQMYDVILNINGDSTDGWTVDQAVAKIRGEEGTTVKLTIKRGDEAKDYNITREVVNNPSVTSEVKDGVGTMTITRFDNETGELARLAAQEFKNQNVKAVILDLRDNSGGYVDAANDVAGLWLENKTIVTERSDNVITDTLKSGNDAILKDIPTVVLVNGGTASASEIVSGALQDYGVAKIVGEQTYGKGCVQQILNLQGGAMLKVTIAKWYTPKGRNISEEGITPDNQASLTQSDVDAGVDPQINKAKEVLGL